MFRIVNFPGSIGKKERVDESSKVGIERIFSCILMTIRGNDLKFAGKFGFVLDMIAAC